MTFLTIVAVFVIGIVILAIGLITGKSWMEILSLIPILISLVQVIPIAKYVSERGAKL